MVQYLAALGHRRIARLAGVGEFAHTAQRTEAFLRIAGELGLEPQVVVTDYMPESGARAMRRLLSARDLPTAIICDSDVLAVTALGVAQQMSYSVPEDLSIVGWDDSLISRVVHPPLTAVTRDIEAYGAAAARQLLAAIDGEEPGDLEAPAAELTPRGSTAPARTHARPAR